MLLYVNGNGIPISLTFDDTITFSDTPRTTDSILAGVGATLVTTLCDLTTLGGIYVKILKNVGIKIKHLN